MRWSGWFWAVYSAELRRMFAYRTAFWVQFVLAVVLQLVVGFALWGSVYASRGEATLGGYTLHGMVLYYVVSGMLMRALHGERITNLADEIYSGGLNRFLLYPVNIFGYQCALMLGQATVYLLQLGIALSAFLLWFGAPSEMAVTLGSLAAFALVFVAGFSVMLCMQLCVNLLAFWADHVWEVSLMVRFIGTILGGAIIPLTLFPEWSRTLIALLPFEATISVPLRALVGLAGIREVLIGSAIALLWTLFFLGLANLLFERGRLRYTGVGI